MGKQNARIHKFNRYYQKLQPRSTGRTSNSNLNTQNMCQNKLLPKKQILPITQLRPEMFVKNIVSSKGAIQNNTECRSHQRRGRHRAQSTSVPMTKVAV